MCRLHKFLYYVYAQFYIGQPWPNPWVTVAKAIGLDPSLIVTYIRVGSSLHRVGVRKSVDLDIVFLIDLYGGHHINRSRSIFLRHSLEVENLYNHFGIVSD